MKQPVKKSGHQKPHYGKGKAPQVAQPNTSQLSSTTCYELSLVFHGPLLSKQSGTLALGIDSAMQTYQHKPVLNGSLIRGNLRDYLEQFVGVLPESEAKSLQDSISRWFGKRTRKGETSVETLRGSVHFDLFWTLTEKAVSKNEKLASNTDTKNEPNRAKRTRIKLNENGSVETGALQFIEDRFQTGTEVECKGLLRTHFHDEQEHELFQHWISKVLQFIPAMGSLKGVGYGRLKENGLKLTRLASSTTTITLSPKATRFGIRLKLNQPFCIGKPRTPDSNRIESEDYIAGNVIKGVIARLFEDTYGKEEYRKRLRNDLCFDDLIFSHALPVAKDKQNRLSPIPLSLAKYQDKYVDMSQLSDPCLFHWQGEKAPAFQPDWKNEDWGKVKTQCHIESQSPNKLLLVRTAIDGERGAAADGELFSVECVDPTGFEWCSNVNLSRVPESRRQGVLRKLSDVLALGLDGIGKTKARAELTISHNAFDLPHGVLPVMGEITVITLVTAAKLLPDDMETLAAQWDSSIPEHEILHKLYQQYWAEHSLNGLSLQRYFAQQKREGGAFVHHHFQKGQPYRPTWLTVAGSVFVLKVESEQGLQALKKWQAAGLPAQHQSQDGKAAWETTAYLPEHGYGEICVNWSAQTQHFFDPQGNAGEQQS